MANTKTTKKTAKAVAITDIEEKNIVEPEIAGQMELCGETVVEHVETPKEEAKQLQTPQFVHRRLTKEEKIKLLCGELHI